MRWLAYIVLGALWWAALSYAARADDYSYSHTHEGDVGKFYQTWQVPDPAGFNGARRNGSCCNKTDCRPVAHMKKGGGGTQVQLIEPDGSLSFWYTVPDKKWEDQQPDPRESPDGRAHACVRNGLVICAVRGSDG